MATIRRSSAAARSIALAGRSRSHELRAQAWITAAALACLIALCPNPSAGAERVAPAGRAAVPGAQGLADWKFQVRDRMTASTAPRKASAVSIALSEDGAQNVPAAARRDAKSRGAQLASATPTAVRGNMVKVRSEGARLAAAIVTRVLASTDEDLALLAAQAAGKPILPEQK